MPLLEIKNLSYSYDSTLAIRNINLSVEKGEIVTIIGSNGAGKSTIMKCISNLVDTKGKKGNIIFDNKDITLLSGNKVSKEGIMQVLEGRHIFSQLTVHENLLMGAFLREDTSISKDIDRMYKRFPILKERRNQFGGTLSGGEQQMLAIARALLNNPKLLLLDEPSLGLAPIIVKDIFKIIKQINKEDGTTILLVEQNSKSALEISNRGYVLQNGNIVMSGMSSELLNNNKVKEAYLGVLSECDSKTIMS